MIDRSRIWEEGQLEASGDNGFIELERGELVHISVVFDYIQRSRSQDRLKELAATNRYCTISFAPRDGAAGDRKPLRLQNQPYHSGPERHACLGVPLQQCEDAG